MYSGTSKRHVEHRPIERRCLCPRVPRSLQSLTGHATQLYLPRNTVLAVQPTMPDSTPHEKLEVLEVLEALELSDFSGSPLFCDATFFLQSL